MTSVEKDTAMAELNTNNSASSAGVEMCCDSALAEGAPTDDAIEMFGLRISRLNRAEVFQRISERIASRAPGIVVTPNVDHICRCHVDPMFREAYASAFLSLPDGMPILWSAKLVGKPLKEKLSGSDMVPLLAEYAANQGHTVFFLGAAEGVAEEAKNELCRRYPKLIVKGVYSPPMHFERNEHENSRVIQLLRNAAPDLCFLALGSPRQEIWMYQHSVLSGVPVMIGVGAGLDFIAGRVRRAPVWMQRVGLEWVWRLCMEPRRLWRRYLVEDSIFFALVWREFWKSRHSDTKIGR
jgi:N-acetylglucosaminyldiphosphoundecaprenol N-acetyl-beta-D-mannosaminyltransferase